MDNISDENALTSQEISLADFEKIDMRVGTILEASLNEKARKPAYRLVIDFGDLGMKLSSAQLTELYTAEQLVGRQVIAVVNFPPRRVAGVNSEVLVLGTNSINGTVLLQPADGADNGDKVY